jgi:transposase
VSSTVGSAASVNPAGHGIGKSRGGLTSKIHHAVDGHGRPLAAVVTGGQRNDGAMLAEVLADIRVPRLGLGRPRTTPDAVIADRAYISGVNRTMLARRGIKTVIPQKKDEIAARKRKGSAGGRPPALDAATYKRRNVVERSFSLTKQWRGLATRYDKLAITYRAAVVLSACITWTRI